jgi:hypothetical protein
MGLARIGAAEQAPAGDSGTMPVEGGLRGTSVPEDGPEVRGKHAAGLLTPAGAQDKVVVDKEGHSGLGAQDSARDLLGGIRAAVRHRSLRGRRSRP